MNLVEQHLAPFSEHSAFWAEAIKVLRMSSFPPLLWLMDEKSFILVFSLSSSHKFGWTHLNSKMEENLWLWLTFVRYVPFMLLSCQKLWCNLRIHFFPILTEKSVHLIYIFRSDSQKSDYYPLTCKWGVQFSIDFPFLCLFVYFSWLYHQVLEWLCQGNMRNIFLDLQIPEV